MGKFGLWHNVMLLVNEVKDQDNGGHKQKGKLSCCFISLDGKAAFGRKWGIL